MTTPFTRSLRARGKTPRVDQLRTSYAMLVRDGFLDRIKAMTVFTGFTFSSNVALQVQPDDVPFCGVYLIHEMMNPDGDANAGEVRFKTMLRLGISVIIQNNDAAVADRTLDTINQILLTKLFTDHSLYDNKIFKIQSFSQGKRTHVFGNLLKDNETPIAELRLEIDCDLGVITYEPQITDDLEVIHVETRFPVGGTQAEIDATQQVTAVYDMEQGS